LIREGMSCSTEEQFKKIKVMNCSTVQLMTIEKGKERIIFKLMESREKGKA